MNDVFCMNFHGIYWASDGYARKAGTELSGIVSLRQKWHLSCRALHNYPGIILLAADTLLLNRSGWLTNDVLLKISQMPPECIDEMGVLARIAVKCYYIKSREAYSTRCCVSTHLCFVRQSHHFQGSLSWVGSLLTSQPASHIIICTQDHLYVMVYIS